MKYYGAWVVKIKRVQCTQVPISSTNLEKKPYNMSIQVYHSYRNIYTCISIKHTLLEVQDILKQNIINGYRDNGCQHFADSVKRVSRLAQFRSLTRVFRHQYTKHFLRIYIEWARLTLILILCYFIMIVVGLNLKGL